MHKDHLPFVHAQVKRALWLRGSLRHRRAWELATVDGGARR